MDVIFSEKILPKTKGPVACPVMLVEPGPGEVAELVHHRAAQLSGKFQDRCLDGGVKKESQEGVGISIRVHGENGSKVGARLQKLCPVGNSICSGIGKAQTLASSQVQESTRGVACAARNSTRAAGVPRPVATEPASAIPATQHSSLDSELSDLFSTSQAGGEEVGWGGEGHVRVAKVRKGGQGRGICAQLFSPEAQDKPGA